VTSCFEVFIATNLMVQSKFNLVFWPVSYNIFFIVLQVGPALDTPLPLSCSLTRARARTAATAGQAVAVPLNLADVVYVAYVLPFVVQLLPSAMYRRG
jgi:hypothetical protein